MWRNRTNGDQLSLGGGVGKWVNEKVQTFSYRITISEEVIYKMMMIFNNTILYICELLRE